MQSIQFGTPVKDKITGFAGLVTGFCTYITGCDQYLVQPPMPDDRTFIDSKWIDVSRLAETGPAIITSESINAGRDAASTGADTPAPIK